MADFIGEINFVAATAVDGSTVRLGDGSTVTAATPVAADGPVTLALRPERLVLRHGGDPVPAGQNHVAGKVTRRTYHGDVFHYAVDAPAGPFEVKEENRPGVRIFEIGETVTVTWRPVGVDGDRRMSAVRLRRRRSGDSEAPLLGLEDAGLAADARRGFLLALPSWAYLTVLFAIPMLIVVVISFASRSSTGMTVLANWNIESYRRLFDPLVGEIALRSLVLAGVTTAICLLIAYPLAYLHRHPTHRPLPGDPARAGDDPVLVELPGPHLRLEGHPRVRRPHRPGHRVARFEPLRLLFTNTAVLIGLVYGFLPFMVLPLYAALDRMDWRPGRSRPRSLRRRVAPRSAR